MTRHGKFLRGGLEAIVILIVIAASACTSPTGPSSDTFSIHCPAGPSVQSIEGSPIAVTFESPALTGGSPPVTTTCTPQSGTLFSVGTTNIACQSSDSAGHSASCAFALTVRTPPRLLFTQFLAFGDSITEGTAADPVTVLNLLAGQLHLVDLDRLTALFLAAEPYPLGLERRLGARYPQQSFRVINAGIGGEFVAGGGVARFRGVLLDNHPEVVLLMEGTNDLLLPSGFDTALAALDSMVQEAQFQGRRVCLATIPPQRPDGLRNRGPVAQRIPAFNDRIRAIAAARQVVLVDVFNAMKDDLSLIGIDDLHPTERGYSVISDTFTDAIRSNFEQTQTVAIARSAR